ncbi:MAG: glycosyltransferase [Deltaproteobacteria bacterium]|nr:glycosyltransferase [Deltaproteobacteria bacterium]
MIEYFEGVIISLVLWGCAGGWLIAFGFLVRIKLVTPELETFPVPNPTGESLPKVTAIVPARNEAGAIEKCLLSLLAQEGIELSVIAVNDRSDDATGEKMVELSRKNPRLEVIHVKELPKGWLGKNHACHLASTQAKGDWLLFTDGDVSFEPSAVLRALKLAEFHGLGHLAVSPRMITRGRLERAFQATFGILFSLNFNLWRLQTPGSRAYVGLGAFNLVRRSDYEQIGGHRPLAMEVLDDVKLGLLLRRGGVAQGFASGGGLVSVRWQPGFRASLKGLQKNLFAGTEWRWAVVISGSFFLSLSVLAPWVGLLLASGAQNQIWQIPPSWAYYFPALLGGLAPISILGVAVWKMFPAEKPVWFPGLEGLAAPLAVLIFVAALIMSATMATLRGGIFWRETFYPLRELKQGCVRESSYPAHGAPGWAAVYPPQSRE